MAHSPKMPVFKGLDDPEQFWFVVEMIWRSQNITDENMKKVKLITTLKDRALSWYMKYSSTNQNATLAQTKTALNVEFKKPKSQSQCITEIK